MTFAALEAGWPTPPTKIVRPVMVPRAHGEPLPVSSPVSGRACENAMLIPAPTAGASNRQCQAPPDHGQGCAQEDHDRKSQKRPGAKLPETLAAPLPRL